MSGLRFTPLTRNPSRSPGRVYLVKAVDQAIYKIGASKKLTGRMRYFHTNLPFKVELIHVIETPDPKRLEHQFHRMFWGRRINGEWFRLSEADVELFKNYEPGAAITNDPWKYPEGYEKPTGAISRRTAKRRVAQGHPGL